VLMTGRRRGRRLFQFSLRELVFELVAVSFSAGLLRYAVMQESFLVGVAGVMLLGGAIGAAIGRSLDDERGGGGLMGAFLGALALPVFLPVLLCVALIVYVYVRWVMSGAS
jgi:hypothetical protein